MVGPRSSRCALFAALGVCVSLLLFGGCASLMATKIGDIKAHPRDYDGKTVTVAGEVTGSLNVLVVKAYTLKDATGEIVVVTDRSVPATGEKVRAHGRVNQAFAIGGESMIVLVEKSAE